MFRKGGPTLFVPLYQLTIGQRLYTEPFMLGFVIHIRIVKKIVYGNSRRKICFATIDSGNKE